MTRTAEAVHQVPLGLALSWEPVEQELGTALPADYKEFCACFGAGEFSNYLTVYSVGGTGESQLLSRTSAIWRTLEQLPVTANVYQPYGFYRPGASGLLSWGTSVTAAEFFWLVSPGVTPERWPVVAREEDGEWSTFDVSCAEFVYRLLTDVSFEDFTIAHLVDLPSYRPDD
ncbi:SMI1/KNR4 family protein [Streptomyces sp. GSL17-111]|uniref:SMI1/KNR4 family protein n=1 Tax=Streptomyces sp. GSL17-111 TaxID=3121596 RepID=UPI0030F3D25A